MKTKKKIPSYLKLSSFQTVGQKCLVEWMKTNNVKIIELAFSVQVSFLNASRWVHGKCIPRIERAFKIEELTDGHVDSKMWLTPISKPLKGPRNAKK
jgi:hypothetical protein